MMGLMFQDNWATRAAGSMPAAFEEERDEYFGLYTGGDQRVGYLRMQGQPQVRDDQRGYWMAVTLDLTMALLGTETRLEMTGDAFMLPEGNVPAFDLVMRSGDTRWRAAGSLGDGRLDAQMETGGVTIPINLPLGEGLDLRNHAELLGVPAVALAPGEELTLETFNPMTLQPEQAVLRSTREETIAVGGVQTRAYVVEADFGSMQMTSWVTPEGDLLRAQMPFGLELRKLTQAEALAPLDPTQQASLIEQTAVRPTGKPVRRGAMQMTYRVGGLPDGISLPSDDVQEELEPGTFRNTAPSLRDLAHGTTLTDAEPYLASDPFIQSEHPLIQAQAREIVAGKERPLEQAYALYTWVFENLKKEAQPAIPSALDVLQTRTGDCNEHTILFTALARSIGLPTRVALGVVWSAELGGFYYHAWPEIWLGQWVWMDPTLGQPVADATHIKLFTGGIDQWMRLADFLGRIEIEVVGVEGEVPSAAVAG